MKLVTDDPEDPFLLHLGAPQAFIEEAKQRYDWVILDGGCVQGGRTGPLDLFVDGTLLVVDSNSTRRMVVYDVLKKLGSGPDRFHGVVLNRRRMDIPKFLYDRT